jgi:Reverse transcriptase (RNA-dependent DNA polymerase)/GAG-pre-integrase domain
VRSVGKCTAAFVTVRSETAFSIAQYPLKNSAILDSGTIIHIFNEISRFLRFRIAPQGDFVWAGDSKIKVLGYGDVDIEIQGPQGKRILRLHDVALCEDFACNLVSLRQLHKQGYWWDNRPGFNQLRQSRDNSTVAILEFHHNQFVLEYVPEDISRSAFHARRNKFNSWSERKPVTSDAWKWHLRLGHPGPQALEHLVKCSQGAKIRGPTTVECQSCGLTKAKRQIRREARDIFEGPGLQLAVDFHDYEKSDKGFKSTMLITDRWSGQIWDYYLTDRTAASIIAALKDFFERLERQYGIKPKVIECDNELYLRKHDVRRFLEQDKRMKIEPSAAHTQSQNGAAERSGGVVKDKARAMREGAKLPGALWPEINRAAVYLHNRTPRYIYNWKSPYERFHTYLAFRDGIVVEHRKPQQAHLRVYGCKAYTLTAEAQEKLKRKQRFNPKAWIGFLIGYDSTNNYRIWNPKLNKVISTRDVIFDEDSTFSGDISQLKDDLLHVNVNELATLLTRLDQTPKDSEIIYEPSLSDEVTVCGGFESIDDEPIEVQPMDVDTEVSKEGDAEFSTGELAYPTPEQTPPAALLAATIENEGDLDHRPEDSTFEVWKASFNAGTLVQITGAQNHKVIDRARIQRLLRKPQGLKALHRRDLPPEPVYHRDLANHPLGTLFEQAEKDHLRGHEEMKTWTEIQRTDPRAKDQQILDCKWVYIYKYDKHGRLAKCKARLVVRGDQQLKSAIGNTYAATLAVRSFRTLIAIAARFDLELLQYDAVNAFVNADLDENVFMRLPPGHRKSGKILILNKALFGLRKSPILWQKLLTKALQDIGFKPIPHETCCLTYDGITIFFYVDDIVLAFRNDQKVKALGLIDQLQRRFKLSGGEELQWFLGIEVIRDRKQKLIWLSQSAYIDKIANLADTKQSDKTPMAREELLPYEQRAPYDVINRYQKKVGSLLYAAVTTRADIAFAVSRLSRFMTNPAPEHHAAADRVLLYLKRYRDLGLQFGGGDDFLVASDASFADNTVDRKSSQAYAMQLFGGLIGWRANKQETVTTSTTEAELLALSQATKEGIYVSRLLQELTVKLDDHRIRLLCDNVQTIRLVNDDIARLQTKLRHVDIHNHWLRQEVQRQSIIVQYTPSEQMIADGLTKALLKDGHEKFKRQIGLTDISTRLQERKTKELQKELDLDAMLQNE